MSNARNWNVTSQMNRTVCPMLPMLLLVAQTYWCTFVPSAFEWRQNIVLTMWVSTLTVGQTSPSCGIFTWQNTKVCCGKLNSVSAIVIFTKPLSRIWIISRVLVNNSKLQSQPHPFPCHCPLLNVLSYNPCPYLGTYINGTVNSSWHNEAIYRHKNGRH